MTNINKVYQHDQKISFFLAPCFQLLVLGYFLAPFLGLLIYLKGFQVNFRLEVNIDKTLISLGALCWRIEFFCLIYSKGKVSPEMGAVWVNIKALSMFTAYFKLWNQPLRSRVTYWTNFTNHARSQSFVSRRCSQILTLNAYRQGQHNFKRRSDIIKYCFFGLKWSRYR